MKIYLYFALLSLLVATADAGVSYPTVVADLKDSGINPELQWKASTSVGSVDMEGGVKSSMALTTDLPSLPKSVWCKMKSEVSGWGVTQQLSINLKNSNAPTSQTTFVNQELDTSIQSVSDFQNTNILISKGFQALGGRAFVKPRYCLSPNASSADVTLGYNNDSTFVQLEASKQNQKLTVSQKITENDTLTPSVTSKGDLALAWKRALAGGDSVTTTIEAKKSLSVQWNDGPWTATIQTPIDNFPNGEVKVKVGTWQDGTGSTVTCVPHKDDGVDMLVHNQYC